MKMSEWLLPLPIITIDDQFRFWDKVNKTVGCWLWTASLYDKRYGRFSIGKGSYSAHRVSWKIHFGADPSSLLVCHTCNVTRCVRPDHLYLGTNAENQQQRSDEGRLDQKGSLNPNAKLEEFEVIQIRKELEAGVKRSVIAKKYMVTTGLIHQIAHRTIWSHV